MAPSPFANASTSASVAMGTGVGAGAVSRSLPGAPRTSAGHAASSASVLSATRPVQFVVRSSVWSWNTDRHRPSVSFASSSSTTWRFCAAFRNAGSVSSADSGTPSITGPPRCAWTPGIAAWAAGARSRNEEQRKDAGHVPTVARGRSVSGYGGFYGQAPDRQEDNLDSPSLPDRAVRGHLPAHLDRRRVLADPAGKDTLKETISFDGGPPFATLVTRPGREDASCARTGEAAEAPGKRHDGRSSSSAR